MTDKKKTLIVISGPTAIGKTNFAIDIAGHFNSEIVSSDSRQLFKELTIGTAKPSAKQLAAVKHHFISSHSINTVMNAGLYEKECLIVLDELFKKHDVVIMTGGTGLYMDVIINGIDSLPPANQNIRVKLNDELKLYGLDYLATRLKEKDVQTFNRIDINNPVRVMRALEVFEITGKPYSSFLEQKKIVRSFNVKMYCLHDDREKLYQKINLRVDEMLAEGLEHEVKTLLSYRNHNALQTVGYKEFFEFFDGKYTIEQTIELIKKNTRNYAKRQLTWFRRYKDMKWITPTDFAAVIGG